MRYCNTVPISFRAKIEILRGQQIKAPVNFEVVELLQDGGTCVPYEDEKTDQTYDSCIYSKVFDLSMKVRV